MRLLDTWTGMFVEKDPRDPTIKYAILSHTWNNEGEQTHEEVKRIQKRYAIHVIRSRYRQCSGGAQEEPSSIPLRTPVSSRESSQRSPDSLSTALAVAELSVFWDDQMLSPKIREACKVARERGFLYIWIDSCCIDKSSSSELSEAINSMFYWYSRAEVCYAFLADVPAEEDPVPKDSHFRRSRWFTRGWTLQELIAPVQVVFFSKDWTIIGSKSTLADVVTDVTNIDRHALLHVKGLEAFSIAQRFSWAARRQTTRLEDRAYSLLGLFDLYMPTLYGEGNRAFQRLQEEILRRIPDQSLFAWTSLPFDSRSLIAETSQWSLTMKPFVEWNSSP
ncbi:hypothetical protein GSI_08817 [Ganoderma sinense ZZ0214-1]|uniref:Uncharacterized protein n=1 Tax=Ganoderma sinense ZZ0214-1 TaxID=1077348 RepID=A0A2G8S4R8_9APHY|nr:hypothetical protein GSI_08817 [Ganoderma sinense ZZ0214-1]